MAQCCLPLLGKLHEFSHGPAAVSVAVITQADDASLPDHGTSGLQDLFGQHSSADCQWFGHMALGYALLGHDAQPQLLVMALHQASELYALLLRQSPALYFARGPPTV